MCFCPSRSYVSTKKNVRIFSDNTFCILMFNRNCITQIREGRREMELKLLLYRFGELIQLAELLGVPIALYLLRHKGVAARVRTQKRIEEQKLLMRS